MNKQNKLIIICLLVFAAVLSVFVFLNKDNIAKMQEYQKNALFNIKLPDEEKLFSMDDVFTLTPYEPTVVQRSATFGNGKFTYTGVLLRDLLEMAGADIEAIDMVVVNGADGYVSGITGKELRNTDSVYLCYYKNGSVLGDKASGGSGPFQLIVSDDIFAQRWVRFVSEIVVEYKDGSSQPQQTETSIETTIVDETETIDEEVVSAQAEAEKKLNIINQFTVDLSAEEIAVFESDAFFYLLMPHIEQEELLKRWKDADYVHELTLEYNDPVYGTAELRFKGANLHETFLSYSDVAVDYSACKLHNRSGECFEFTREEMIDQEIYLMAYCEDRVFGYPADGGTGPFWLVSVKDGKLRFISDRIVTINITLPRGARF